MKYCKQTNTKKLMAAKKKVAPKKVAKKPAKKA